MNFSISRALRICGFAAILGTTPAYAQNVHDTIKDDIQPNLKYLGLYTGPIDGLMGPKTDRAIRQFEKLAALQQDGYLSAYEIRVLKERVEAKRQLLPELQGYWRGRALCDSNLELPVVLTVRYSVNRKQYVPKISLSPSRIMFSDRVDVSRVGFFIPGTVRLTGTSASNTPFSFSGELDLAPRAKGIRNISKSLVATGKLGNANCDLYLLPGEEYSQLTDFISAVRQGEPQRTSTSADDIDRGEERNTLTELQTTILPLFRELNLYSGPIYGGWNSQVEMAIRAFEQKAELEQDGYLDQADIDVLKRLEAYKREFFPNISGYWAGGVICDSGERQNTALSVSFDPRDRKYVSEFGVSSESSPELSRDFLITAGGFYRPGTIRIFGQTADNTRLLLEGEVSTGDPSRVKIIAAGRIGDANCSITLFPQPVNAHLTVSTENSAQSEEIAKLRDQLDAANTTIVELRASLNGDFVPMAEFNAKIREQQQQAQKLRDQLDAANTTIAELRQSISSNYLPLDQANRLRRQLDASTEVATELRQRMANDYISRGQYESELSSLVKQVDALNATLVEIQTASSTYRNRWLEVQSLYKNFVDECSATPECSRAMRLDN